MRPVHAGRYSRQTGSAADVSIDNFAEPLPRLAFEPHHLHLGNGGEVGRRRIDLDTGQKAAQLEIPHVGRLFHDILAREVVAAGPQNVL